MYLVAMGMTLNIGIVKLGLALVVNISKVLHLKVFPAKNQGSVNSC